MRTPWIATFLAIGAALVVALAFRFYSSSSPHKPTRWVVIVDARSDCIAPLGARVVSLKPQDTKFRCVLQLVPRTATTVSAP